MEPSDEESRTGLGIGGRGGRTGGNGRAKWGARGISVSADDGVLDHEEHHGMLDDEDDEEEHGVIGQVDPDAKMQDPDELAKALEDDDDEDATLPGGNTRGEASASGVRGGDEWND